MCAGRVRARLPVFVRRSRSLFTPDDIITRKHTHPDSQDTATGCVSAYVSVHSVHLKMCMHKTIYVLYVPWWVGGVQGNSSNTGWSVLIHAYCERTHAFLSMYAHFLQVIVTCTAAGVCVLDGRFTERKGAKVQHYNLCLCLCVVSDLHGNINQTAFISCCSFCHTHMHSVSLQPSSVWMCMCVYLESRFSILWFWKVLLKQLGTVRVTVRRWERVMTAFWIIIIAKTMCFQNVHFSWDKKACPDC